jgi:hypothetical protein
LTEQIQVHLGAGIGNIVLATPLLLALHDFGFVIDVVLAADYPETVDLLRPWSVVREVFIQDQGFPCGKVYSYVIPAIPPFYWQRYAKRFAGVANVVARPPDTLFYQNEQEYYWNFAKSLGYGSEEHPWCILPITGLRPQTSTKATLVLAPGCKTGEMAAKRWPYYSDLAEEFDDVAVVGTPDDLRHYDDRPLHFGRHVKMFVGKLTLRETAELLASAGAVVANDTGLAYVSAAVGTPTLILFGPTPNITLGRLPSNVRTFRTGLNCEPCWFDNRFKTCAGRIDCLRQLSVSSVREQVLDLLGARR